MVLRTNSFDTGTEGAAVTAVNSAVNGDAFTAVETTLTYAASAAAHGAKGAISTNAAVSAYARYTINTSSVAVRIYFSIDTVPTSDCHLIQVSRSGVRVGSVHLNGAGKLRISDATGTTGVWTAASAISANTWYWLDLLVTVGATTSDGVLSCDYGTLGGASIESTTYSTANLGTTAVDNIYFGKRSTVTYVVKMDTVAWEEGRTTRIGPLVTPPTIVHTEDPGICVVDARSSTAGDATSLTYSLAPTTGVTEPVDGLFLVEQQTTDVVYTLTVTQSGSGYTDTLTVPAVGAAEGGTFRRIWTGTVWD